MISRLPPGPTATLSTYLQMKGLVSGASLNRYHKQKRKCPWFANDDLRAEDDWDPETGEYQP